VPKQKLKIAITISVFLVLLVLSTSLFPANAASISMVNHYPDDGETYDFVDHFIEQVTAVNTNTTVSVSIDGQAAIPMTYQGIKNEVVPGDTVARDWHTWNITVPPITTPGAHTFQFFKHYYVWQETDPYWAEFNSNSALQTFAIAGASTTPSLSPQPETTNHLYLLITIIASAITSLILLVALALRKRNKNNKNSPHITEN
jgi:hypothetical protein